MSAVLDYQQYGQLPHRKPLPTGPSHAAAYSTSGPLYPQTLTTTHSRTRTTSSSVFPPQPQQQQQHPVQPITYTSTPPMATQPFNTSTRRTLSNATSSTSSSAAASSLARAPTNTTSYASSIRRSTSSRSTTPTSYVALMRKQKATVWCDRAQHEDPRILAQQRAAKHRAQMEVVGGHNAARISTSSGGGVRSKIRHHGAVKASTYTAANLSGAGVPMRLSASEVDEGESEDERDYSGGRFSAHRRNGSRQSSLGSGRAASAVYGVHGQQGQGQRYSSGSTPPSAQSYSPVEGEGGMGYLAEEETPGPDMYKSQTDYFDPGRASGGGSGSGSGSGSSEERFGDVGGLPERSAERDQLQLRQTSEELRRRGSVDDRTMTMSGVRLFVANPDLSD